MKAYVHEIDGHLQIAFLENGIGPDDECLHSPGRAEWADKYAPAGPVPARAWMENGYTYGCLECEHQLDLSDGYCDRCAGDCVDDDDDVVAEAYREMNEAIVFDGDYIVFCGEACRQTWNARKEAEAVAKEDAKHAFLDRNPFCEVKSAWIGGLGQCQCFDSNRKNVVLDFLFPGATKVPNGIHYCCGCKKAWMTPENAGVFNQLKNAVRCT